MLQRLKLLITILPHVIELMKSIEAAIPGAGKGEQKLALLRSLLESVADSADDITRQWPWIADVVSRLVTTFNATGIFGGAK